MENLKSKTQWLYLASYLLCSPLEAMFTLLIFILSKEMGANAWQLTILACAKPVVSIFAFYASSIIDRRSDLIRSYLLITNLIGCIFCFTFPFMENIWLYIFAYAIFMTMRRATFPAWNEILKEKIGLLQMRSLISKGTSIHYFIMMCIPFLFSFWMDNYNGVWKFLFFIVATLQLFNSFLIICLPSSPKHLLTSTQPSYKPSLITPWKNAVKLLYERPDFANYLLMFLLGGAGLIAIQPILPIFFKQSLDLSYKQLTLAISLCKGVAFLSTSGIWAQWSHRISLYLLNCYMNLFSCLFFFFLMLSTGSMLWLFVAYLMYGTMQAGCEISWNLSGPLFSKDEHSASYSSLNLAMVGIRGCIFPLLGQLLFIYSNPNFVFLSSGFLCFISLIYAFCLHLKYNQDLQTREIN